MPFLLNKKTVIIFAVIVVLSFFAPTVFAVWNGTFYEPGDTLNPECLPTDVDCDVRAPLTSLNISDAVYGAGWDTDTTHAPSKNALYDKIEGLVAGSHNPITLGVSANGLSLATQVLSLALASTSTTGALSDTDWDTFNNKVSSQWTTSASDVYYNTGSVGIGTTTPTSKIHGVTTLSAATGDEVAYSLDYTTNKAAGNDTGLLINMTDTASPGTSLPLDIKVGGSSKFSVSNLGAVTSSNITTGNTAGITTATIQGNYNSSNYNLGIQSLNSNVANNYGIKMLYGSYGPIGTTTGGALWISPTENSASGTPTWHAVSLTPTYNHSGTTGAIHTDLLINRTETALGTTPGAQYLIDAQVGGVSMFKVTNTGQTLFADGSAGVPSIGFASAPTLGFYRNDANSWKWGSAGVPWFVISQGTNNNFASGATGYGSISMGYNATISFDGAAPSTGDTVITRGGVATVQLGRTQTSPISHTLTASSARGGTDTNGAGANLTIQSGLGTGNAIGSNLYFATPDAVASGTTAQTASTKMTILGNGNVGIGTTSPLSKLSINGGLHVGGDSDAGDNNLLVDGRITAPTIWATGLMNTDTIGIYNTNTTFTLNSYNYATANRFAITAAGGTFSQDSGTNGALKIIPIYNQVASTAANTDLLINRTQTAVGSGAQNLIDAQVGGVSKFSVSNTGVISSGSTGTQFHTETNGGIYISGALSFGNNAYLNYGGTVRTITMGQDGYATTNQTFRAEGGRNGTDTNYSGASLTLAGGPSTGTGVGGNLIFQTSGTGTTGTGLNALTTRMTIDSTGKVGIGESPTANLSVKGLVNSGSGTNLSSFSSLNNTNVFIINDAGAITAKGAGTFNYNGSNNISKSVVGADFTQYNSSGTITNYIQTAGNSYFNGGNVGIGTTTPGDLLEIYGSSPLIKFNRSGNYTWEAGVGNGASFPTSYFGIKDTVANITRFIINTSGNVGIGTTAPTANFQVDQGTSGTGTVSTPGSSTTLTGVGTQFTNTFKVGDTITVTGETVRTIATITSDTVLDVTVAFSATPRSAVAYTLTGGTRFSVFGNGNAAVAKGLTINGGLLTDNNGKLATGIKVDTALESGLYVTDNFAADAGSSFISSNVTNRTNFPLYNAFRGTTGVPSQSVSLPTGLGFTYYGNTSNGTNAFSNGIYFAQVQTVNAANTGTSYGYVSRNYMQDNGTTTAALSNYVGFYSAGQMAVATPTVTNHYDFRADDYTSAANGVVTNRYGLYLGFNTTGVTNAWGVYQSDSGVKNYFAGNVGIGTTTPGQRLHVDSGTTNVLPLIQISANNLVNNYIGNASSLFTGGLATELGISANTKLMLGTGTAVAPTMTLTGGNVGIGTPTPGSQLTVLNGATIATDVAKISSAFNIGNNSVLNLTYTGADGGRALSVTDSSYNTGTFLVTKTTGAAASNTNVSGMLINATYQHSDAGGAGSIGNGAKIVAANNTAAAGTLYGLDVSATANTAGATAVGLRVTAASSAGTPYAAIFSGGNVGIGTTTPGNTLSVSGSADINGSLTLGATQFLFRQPSQELILASGSKIGWSNNAGVSGARDIGLSRLAAGVLSVDTTAYGNSLGTLVAGNVGIGTATPTEKLTLTEGRLLASGVTPPTLASQTSGGVDESLNSNYEAVKFTMSGTSIGGIELQLKRTGTISAGTIAAYLYTDSGGAPGTNISDTSTGQPTLVYGAGLTTSYETYYFREQVTGLTNGASYWIVIAQSGIAGGGSVEINSRTSGTALHATSADASSWATEDSKELYYVIEGDTGATISGFATNQYGLEGQSYSGFGVRGTSVYGAGAKFDSIHNFGVGGSSIYGVGLRGSSVNGIAIQGISTGSAGAQFQTTAAGQVGMQVISTTGVASQAVALDPTGILYQGLSSAFAPVFQISNDGSGYFAGNTGIGVAATSKLDILDTTLAGSGSLAGSVLNLAQTWNTTGTPTAIKLNVTNTASNAASLLMDLQVGGVSKFSVSNLGVIQQAGCTTAGTLSADVSGNIICTPSSERFKNTVNDLDDSLSNIMALRPVSYNFNSDMNMGDRTYFGFISEEVADVTSEFATYDKEGAPYGLDTNAILASTVKAIQEMNLNLEDVLSLDVSSPPYEGGVLAESEGGGSSFFSRLLSKLTTWLADAGNGIKNIFVEEVNTKEICISDETGEKTCITKTQLDALLINAGTAPAQITTPTPPPQGGEDTASSPPSEGGVLAPSEGGGNLDPTPVDPIPAEPAPVDPTPTPAPVTTPPPSPADGGTPPSQVPPEAGQGGEDTTATSEDTTSSPPSEGGVPEGGGGDADPAI